MYILKISLKMSKVYTIAEIGINHNGDLDIAKRLITIAAAAGFDSVKFQKRNPDVCVPEHMKEKVRDTPWGKTTYLAYKHRVEFDLDQYKEIDEHCSTNNIAWSASPWDLDSVEFLQEFNLPWVKLASASIVNESLVRACSESFDSVIMSTGMSDMSNVEDAYSWITKTDKSTKVAILHCNSSYPAPLEELNLRCMPTLGARFPKCKIGYSGHEFALTPTIASVALGAEIIERHVTLDRTMWGSDQLCSLEPHAMFKLVRGIRDMEKALGSSDKIVTPSELSKITSLR